MDEALIRQKLKELILDTGLKAYIYMPENVKNYLLALCVSFGDLDWIYEKPIIGSIKGYVLADCHTALDRAFVLAENIRLALTDYYDTILEDMFDETKAQIDFDRNIEAGLKKREDPINGEAIWSK